MGNSNNKINFNQRFVINANDFIKTYDAKNKHKKVLKISSEFNNDKVFSHFSTLNSQFFPNLFFIIIDIDNSQTLKALDDDLSMYNVLKTLKIQNVKFKPNLPIIIQLTSKKIAGKLIYFKAANYLNFKILHENDESFKVILNFLRTNNFENLLENVFKLKDSSLILRFITTLDISKRKMSKIIQECASNGSKIDFLSIIDASTEDENRACSKNITFKNIIPIFFHALKNPNEDVINYLIFKWIYLIQYHSLDLRVDVSTHVYKENKFEILYKLISNFDFPFPKNLDVSKIHYDPLLKLISQRNEIHNFISNGQKNIVDILKEHSNLKFMFNSENQTATYTAIEYKNYDCLAILKSHHYEADPSEDTHEFTADEERIYENVKSKQTITNVEKAVKDRMKSSQILSASSLIHEPNDRSKEVEYRKQINDWFNKIGGSEPCSYLLDCAAQCTNLKIIFDFKSITTENADLKTGPGSNGTTYPISQKIFIGAMKSNENNALKIPGILIHEIGHFSMRQVYENNENPYYKDDENAKAEFTKICNKVREIIAENNNDDECKNIISSVFSSYKENEYHLELIVRPFQILIEYYDDQDKLKYLKQKYHLLFEYVSKYLIIELKNFSLVNQNIIKEINRSAGILSEIMTFNLRILNSKIIDSIFKRRCTIVKSNVIKFFLLDLYQYLIKVEKMPSKKTIFITSDIEKKKSFESFKEALKLVEKVKIIVLCSNEPSDNFLKLIKRNPNSVIFIASKDMQHSNITEIFNSHALYEDADYTFNDFSPESQQQLLNLNINFQNNSKTTLKDLLGDQIDPNCILDDKVLNLITKNNENSFDINCRRELTVEDHLYQPRFFINEDKPKNIISLKDLNLDIAGFSKILISDSPRTGKSWTLQNISKFLNAKHPFHWISCIDSKQYGKMFGNLTQDYNFVQFMIKILKLNHIEANFFKVLYDNGKVFILIDGFNDIQEEFRVNFLKHCESFISNNGNQLWITTRDDQKDKILNNLSIDVVYNLDKFKLADGVKMITKMWMLKDDSNVSTISPNIELKAYELCQNILKHFEDAFNFPEIYEIISHYRSYNESSLNSLAFDVLKELSQRFSHKLKDEIVREIHQYYAIQNTFPEIRIDPPVMFENNVLDFGLMIEKNDAFEFINNAFSYVFVAEFLAINLDSKFKLNNNFLKVLTAKRFKELRIFFDGAISNDKVMKRMTEVLGTFDDYFDNSLNEIFEIIFEENLGNIMKLFLSIFKLNNNFKDVLSSCMMNFVKKEENVNFFNKFFKLLAENLETNDLKDFLTQNQILHEMIRSKIDIKCLIDIIYLIEEKLTADFVRKLLKNEEKNGTLLHYLCKSKIFNIIEFEQFFKILNEFLRPQEIIQILKIDRENNIFNICILTMDINLIKYIYSKLKETSLLNLIKQSNILHFIATCCDEDTSKEMWKILKDTIADKKDCGKFIHQYKNNGNPFLHILLYNQNSKLVIETINTIFKEYENSNILTLRNDSDLNLLHQAVCYSTFAVLNHVWSIYKESLGNNLYFIQEKCNNKNIIQHAAQYASEKKLAFILDDVKLIIKDFPNEFEKLINADLLHLAELNTENINARNLVSHMIADNEAQIVSIKGLRHEEIIYFDNINSKTFKELAKDNIFLHKDVRHRKSVTISAIGSKRKGKSFLLNYSLRLLYANYPSVYNRKQFDPKNWIGHENEPLHGFPWERGSKPVTKGIAIWNDAFLFTDERTGEKIAITVIDTHGIFIDDAPSDDDSKMFMLGSLLSSNFMLNCAKELSSNNLTHLKYLVELKQHVASISNGNVNKFFQNLYFLIRDWDYVEEHQLGFEGGMNYMKEKINVRTEKELLPVIEYLKDTFQNIGCSLLSYPGKIVSGAEKDKGDKIYDGNYEAMDSNFKLCLIDTIEQMLKPESQSLKRINGCVLTGFEFHKLLELIITLFETSQILDPKIVFDETVKMQKTILVNSCYDYYTQNLFKYQCYIKTKTQKEYLHKLIKDKAIVKYNNSEIRKLGILNHDDKFVNQLKDLIDNFHENSEENMKKIEQKSIRALNENNERKKEQFESERKAAERKSDFEKQTIFNTNSNHDNQFLFKEKEKLIERLKCERERSKIFRDEDDDEKEIIEELTKMTSAINNNFTNHSENVENL
ncbi:hypothetical protein ACKWTF_016459 [Chironomus riparius]